MTVIYSCTTIFGKLRICKSSLTKMGFSKGKEEIPVRVTEQDIFIPYNLNPNQNLTDFIPMRTSSSGVLDIPATAVRTLGLKSNEGVRIKVDMDGIMITKQLCPTCGSSTTMAVGESGLMCKDASCLHVIKKQRGW